MSKLRCDQLRATILTLADGAHQARINDLLDALEEEIGAATIRYIADIVQVQADSAPLAYSGLSGQVAQRALSGCVRTVRYTDWERDDIFTPASE